VGKPSLDTAALDTRRSSASLPAVRRLHDWKSGLPVLTGSLCTLRELRPGDAPALVAALAADEVSRLISPPPACSDGFEKFIAWSNRQRQSGLSMSFGIVPRGSAVPVGIIQVRSLVPSFETAEWGFAIGAAFWGTGLFGNAAQLALDFVFDVVGVHRLEARAAIRNGRGNGALLKLGAYQEGVLRRSFKRNGEYLDQALWTILADERRYARVAVGPRLVH
jgi:ribosomal-protein-alanine N-acetyltransferase